MVWHALATYRHGETVRAAIVVDGVVHDLDAAAAHAPALAGRSVTELIADWSAATSSNTQSLRDASTASSAASPAPISPTTSATTG